MNSNTLRQLRLPSAVNDGIDGTGTTAQLKKKLKDALEHKNVNIEFEANRAFAANRALAAHSALRERLNGKPYNGDPGLQSRSDDAKARRDADATAAASMEGIEPGAKINILPGASIPHGSTPMNINGGRRRNTRRRNTRRRNTRRRNTRRR